MSAVPSLAVTTTEGKPFDWFRSLGPRGRRAFLGAFGGWGLDSYDYWVLPFSLSAVIGYFHISAGQGGLLTTVTLVVSAFGGMIAGVVADRIGRVRTLMLTVGTYAVFTVLAGFAWNFESLLAFRALQGLGYGGEWATGAALVAEYADSRYRGKTLAFVQSAWAIGWGFVVVASTVIFSIVPEEIGWRVLLFTGALPALFVLYIRRHVTELPAVTEKRAQRQRSTSFFDIWTDGYARTSFFAALFATGVQGGYYTLATWLPLYLKEGRDLDIVNTVPYYVFLISGAFLGYVSGGYLADRIGRKNTFMLFAMSSAIALIAYTQIPAGANTLVMVLGFPLGFTASAIFSGFGAFLAELYPSQMRGTGQGFTYNFGRAVGAVFPIVIGFLSATSLGIAGAMLFGAVAYGVAVVALFGLPETRGIELA